MLSAELIKAIATGSVPDLVTMDNPKVASFAAHGSLTDLTDRVNTSALIKPEAIFQRPMGFRCVEGPFLRRAARCQHTGTLLQR